MLSDAAIHGLLRGQQHGEGTRYQPSEVVAKREKMGLNWRQFELGVLRPALQGEPAIALKLVGETIWHESDRLRALGQYTTDITTFGPGLGIASIEKRTWNWMQREADGKRWMSYIPAIGILNASYTDLVHDLRLNVWACRFRYKLDPSALPNDTIEDRANYWRWIYNGGTVDRSERYIGNAEVIPWSTSLPV